LANVTTPTFCTLDGDVATAIDPYTPSVDDMGGAAFEDDDVYPPKPTEQVMAADVNQMQMLLVRACRMMPKATFWVRNIAGTVTLMGFKSCNDLFLSTDVTVADAFGTLIVSWPSGKLPVAAVPPDVTLMGGLTNADTAAALQTNTGGVSAIVVTANLGATQSGTYTVRIDVDGEGNLGE
jgi:hypothetical protein